MNKVPHFKPDTVIRRADYSLPLVEMLRCIAARHAFTINLPDVPQGLSRQKRAVPIIDAIADLDPRHKGIVSRELFRLNRIGATPEVRPVMFGFVRASGTEVPDCVKKTTCQDAAAWCFSKMSQQQWEQLVTYTNVRRISASDWTQLLVTGTEHPIVIDTSDEGLAKIRDAVCQSLFTLSGIAEDGSCSHYYDEAESCDYFRLDLLNYPEPKTIKVKVHRFRRRNYQDTFEVDVVYDRRTGMLSVCSGDAARDKAIAHAWIVGVLGAEEAENIDLLKPEQETFNLEFIKHRSANLPVPAGSMLRFAKVVSANTQRRGRGRKGVNWTSDEADDDIHSILERSWRANEMSPDDFVVTRVEILFRFVRQDGTQGETTCRFSKQRSNYLEAPDDLKTAIRDLLIEQRILNAAA